MLVALAIALLIVAHPATAQTGCTLDDPCPWFIDIDADGFSESQWTWSQGDVFEIDVFNNDDADHTLVLEGYDVTIVARGFDHDDGPITGHGPLTLDMAGEFTFRDDTSGDAATLIVLEGDVVDENPPVTSEGRTEVDGDKETPLPLPAMLGGLIVAFGIRRFSNI